MATNLDLRNLSESEINDALLSAQREYVALKLDHATQGLANPNEIKVARRNVAKIKTEIRSRELAAMDDEQIGNRSNIRLRRKLQK